MREINQSIQGQLIRIFACTVLGQPKMLGGFSSDTAVRESKIAPAMVTFLFHMLPLRYSNDALHAGEVLYFV